jgi:hypothetical protein
VTANAWYYLATGKKRHVVRDDDLIAFPEQTAICGSLVLSFLPDQARWRNDSEGLAVREDCASCLRILQADAAAEEGAAELARKSTVTE